MVDEHDRIASELLAKVAQRLNGDEEAGIDKLDISSLKPGDLVRMFVEAVKVQRISRGEPTEINRLEGPGGGPLQHQLSAAPKDDAEALERFQGLEDLGEMPAGTVDALVKLGVLRRVESDDN